MIPLTLFFLLNCASSVILQGCNISLFDTWAPVVFSSNNLKITYPSLENPPDDRNITIAAHSSIIISCNGGHFTDDFSKIKTIQATCNENGKFEAQDVIFDFSQINCVNFDPQIVNFTNFECAPNATLIDIGFQIGQNVKFDTQIEVCFDKINLTALYTHHNISKEIGFIKSYLTTNYVVDRVYDINIDFELVYSNFSYQQQLVNRILNLPEDSTRFVNPKSCQPNVGVTTPGFCFSKRPLTYRGDFVYISQHYATYRYLNVVPQWYFIDYNLDKLERNLIDFVKTQHIDFSIYSGTFDILTLPNNDGKKMKIYFYDDNERKAIPVPLFFWKLVYDTVTFRASVFITINNPHLRAQDLDDHIFCEDISNRISWLTWESQNITKGFSYVCSYEEVRNVISYLPPLYVSGILT